MAARVTDNKALEIAIVAGLAALAVLVPDAADLAEDGFQREDFSALNVIVGSALAAGLRALVLFINPGRQDDGGDF